MPDTATNAADVWVELADRLNPGYERPVLRPGIEERRFTTVHGEEYWIVKNPHAGTYLRLAPEEQHLLHLMDGTRQVKDLVLAYFFECGSFAFHRIVRLVDELRGHGFLTEPAREPWDGLAAHFRERSWSYRVDRLFQSFLYREFPVTGVDGVVAAAYRRAGWLFFTPAALALGGVVSLVGIVLFAREALVAGRDPFRLGDSIAVGVLALFLWEMFTIAVHEAGHALTTKHFGREVHRAGIMLYYGMPTFFVDTTDVWLAPRRARLAVSLAGMAAVWVVGGLAMIYVVLQPEGLPAEIAFQIAFLAFVSDTINLIPLLELDGYYLLMDWLEVPLLRARALAFVRRDLWRKLRNREGFNREERIFAAFGPLALAFSALALAAAVAFWFGRLQEVVVELWTGEALLGRALVVVIAMIIGVPLLFGLGVKLNQLLRTGARRLALLRHRPTAARIQERLDARELVAGLYFLRGLGFAEREAIVDRLRLRRFERGAAVTRQGEAGDNFYLIRSGEAEVVRTGEDGWPHRLVTLERGDYFGEMALLHRLPRRASVRALTPLEVYALSRADFEAILVPHLRVYGLLARWVEERAELAECGLFRDCTPTELDLVLEHLGVEELPAGSIIMEQDDPADRFYLIRTGRVEISRRETDGRRRVIRTRGPGEFFGETALLGGETRLVTAQAAEPVALWSLSKRDFQELLLDELRMGETLTAAMHERRAANLQPLAGEPAA